MPNLKNKKVIKDQQGQRKYPGRVTEIQGNTMSTTGYGDIPLYVIPNVGNAMVVPANSGNRVFPGASSFTEYPIAKNGGWLEKYQVGGKTLDTSNWEQSSLDSLKLFNNSQNLKNLIKNYGNYNNSFETSKPVKRTSTGNFKIPNPNNPIEYKKILDDFGYNIISDKGFPDINLYQNKNIQPTQTLTYTRKESKYKTEKEYNEAAKKIKSFNETPGEASWIGYSMQTYQKPVGVQKKVKTIKEPVKTETVNLTEPVKTQVVNTPNPIDKDRTEVNFGQKYQTFNYPGQHGYSGNDVTSKYFDPTTKNEIDVSKSFDLKGNYNPVYLEQKKYGGWLEQYGDGGETDPPVNLRSASTQLASAVSTQAPEVPLNKTGWDWVKQKYENKQPSEWNMLMMDKSGSYVDSGVDPFSLMLTSPQQVIKAGIKGGKVLLDASKSNKIKPSTLQNVENNEYLNQLSTTLNLQRQGVKNKKIMQSFDDVDLGNDLTLRNNPSRVSNKEDIIGKNKSLVSVKNKKTNEYIDLKSWKDPNDGEIYYYMSANMPSSKIKAGKAYIELEKHIPKGKSLLENSSLSYDSFLNILKQTKNPKFESFVKGHISMNDMSVTNKLKSIGDKISDDLDLGFYNKEIADKAVNELNVLISKYNLPEAKVVQKTLHSQPAAHLPYESKKVFKIELPNVGLKKLYSIIGISAGSAALQNKQDNSQWLDKYK